LVKHPRLFNINVQESLFLFEPPAAGGFPRSWDAGDKEVHAVSLEHLSKPKNVL